MRVKLRIMTKNKHKVLVEGPIPPQMVADSIGKHNSKHDIGAHSIFLGQVRADGPEGKPVAAIEYTAYDDMAEKEFYEIREFIFDKYNDLTCMHVYHSLGEVKAGEISLFVFVSAIHRKQAIDACEEMVNLIKEKVPIWKKEQFEDSTHQWVSN